MWPATVRASCRLSLQGRRFCRQPRSRSSTRRLKVADLDLLADIRAGVDKALAEGTTLREFRRELEPLLKKKGWWGRKSVVDPLTGESVEAQLGSPQRLETIFRTNLRTAYANGHWDSIQRTKERRPYLRYAAVMDDRTRPEHRAWHGTVLPVDDPWWETHAPPNGWNCRCRVIAVSERMLQRQGWQVSERPASPTRPVLNKRTGEVAQVPVGIDLGWDYNPGAGASRAAVLAQGAADRVEAQRAAEKPKKPRAKKQSGPKPVTAAAVKREIAKDRRADFSKQAAAHKAEAGYVDTRSPQAAKARRYTTGDYHMINSKLRRGESISKSERDILLEMKAISTALDDRLLWRGLSVRSDDLGKAATGDTGIYEAPVSTTTAVLETGQFGSGALAAIRVKKGTRGVIWNDVELEVTLLPGTRWRVTKTETVMIDGEEKRLINVEVEGGDYDSKFAKIEGMAANAKDPEHPPGWRPSHDYTPEEIAERQKRLDSEDSTFIKLKPGTDYEAADPRDQPRLDRTLAQLRDLGFIK